MFTENLSTLKINKLTQEQYDRELNAGNIDENALYLTPEEEITSIENGGTGADTVDGARTNLGIVGKKYGNGEIFNDYTNNVANGVHAHAEGYSTTASGDYSHAEGQLTLASGANSHAEGVKTEATGKYSHAEGYYTKATIDQAHAEGNSTIASGNYSHAEGLFSNSCGFGSHAEGSSTTTIGNYSHAEGYSANKAKDIISNLSSSTNDLAIIEAWASNKFSLAKGLQSHVSGKNCLALGDSSYAGGVQTTAMGVASHSEGENTTVYTHAAHAEGYATNAIGIYSHAEGYNTSSFGVASHAGGSYNFANGNSQRVIGKYNIQYDGATDFSDASGSIFIVGVGTSENARANAFRITNAGGCMGTTSFTASGADYAEYFEWTDGNVDNEDRRGYFVTLEGSKIRKANTKDDYILGVISATPSVIGNGYTDMWQGMYLKDIFGERITEIIEIEETIDENTGETIPAHTEQRFVLNPEYDNSQKYVGRNERKEWSAVGTHGQLVVVDDGTCEVNGYCKHTDGGIATKSDAKTSCRVIERLDDTHVRVYIK